jgi:hypothetical protein
LSHTPSQLRRGRRPRALHPSAAGRRPKLNHLNPYSLDANGWCEPTATRAQAYEREGPPADPRAAVVEGESRATLEHQLDELRKVQAPPVDVEKLFAAWATHPRRRAVQALFPELSGTQRRSALRREVGKVRVRSARGDVVDLATKLDDCPALTDLESQRILSVLADLRHAWKTRDADAGYDEINWRHACQEVGQILDVAEENNLEPLVTEDAVLASLFSDAAKLKGNFLTHHIDGAVGAALVLPRFLDIGSAGGRARVVTICQAILEHQVGPPRFMAQMVRMGIEEHVRKHGGSLDGLDGLQQKIADPLNPKHATLHKDGYGVLDVDERESALLARVGLPAWWVPHPSTPWFTASSAVIDADSLVNYVTPDGVGKIVAICGPGTPFHDPTVFHSIFSCGASFVDAVSVMSDIAMPALRDGVQRTRAAIEDMRARVLAEIEEGWLHFSPGDFRTIVDEEDVNTEKLTSIKRDGEILIDVPWGDSAVLPYWNAPLDYAVDDAAFEFAKLIRRRVADLLREA